MISKENVLVKSRQMGMSSLQIAYWQKQMAVSLGIPASYLL